MKVATVTEAKNRLSALLDQVRAGETILIVDRGRPVARLEPALSATEDPEGRLARLERAGIVKRGRGSPLDVLKKPRPKLPKGVSLVRALLGEREESL